MAKTRPYLYYDHVVSLCEHCLRRIEGKYAIRDDQVWMYKWCPEHGHSKVLIATDAKYWRSGREVYIKPPEMPLKFNTEQHWGCPYDCGLCPDHMQHSCLTILEINDHCNLACPVCYASSGPHRTEHKPLAVIEQMLDAICANEGEPDVVQISGGEPTTHPEFFAILDAAKRRPIRHLMLNTNGLMIAREPGFVERLATYAPRFEIYLQFDSFRREALMTLRGADLRKVRETALARLNEVKLSTTLVMTVARGVNDDEIGAVIDFASKEPCVRGVTLQPMQFAGRSDGVTSTNQRLTLTEVRQSILDQTSLFIPSDIIPVPCNPDALAMGYALKTAAGIQPLTRFIGPDILLAGDRSTIVFESDALLKVEVFKLFSTSHGPEGQASSLASLMCCLPNVDAQPSVSYENVFRVLIMAFMDATNFDVRAMKKSCVHLIQEDGRMIPFESFNLLYRGDLKDRLATLRSETDLSFGRETIGAGATTVPINLHRANDRVAVDMPHLSD
jgi:7,8-dihydro-6-hydroxymethylpterin dimethyltransferase